MASGEMEEDKSSISAADLGNLERVVARFAEEIERDGDALAKMKPILRGLASHDPQKRAGYAIVLSSLLDKFGGKIEENAAFEHLLKFKFGKTGKKKKSSQRTGAIAKVLAIVAFVRAKVISSDEAITKAAEVLMEVRTNRPVLQPFVMLSTATLVECSEFRVLNQVAEMIPSNLDGFMFWFRICERCPDSIRGTFPPQFREKEFLNAMTASSLQKTFLSTKQPWLSMVWKHILDIASDEVNLLTFWSQIFEKLMRTGEVKEKMATIYVVKSVLPTLRPSLLKIVVSSTFVKMINSLMVQPMLQEPLQDFLNSVVSIDGPDVLALINAFRYVDYRVSGGFEFHEKLFEKCSSGQLKQLLEFVRAFNDKDMTELRARFSANKVNEDTQQLFRFDMLRALFIASAKVADPNLSLEIFHYIIENFDAQKSSLVADLVAFDENRADGAATYQSLLGEPELSHFACCFQLYNICAAETLIAPDISGAQPSTDFILNAVQKANEPPLVRHAFKSHLKTIIPLIPAKDIEQFFSGYTPIADSFSQATVDIFRVVVENCTCNINLIGPLFQLLCQALKNVGLSLSQAVAQLLNKALEKDATNCAFPYIVKMIFRSLAEMPNKVLTQNERMVFRAFNDCLTAAVKASIPLSAKCVKCLDTQMDAAVSNFAFKTVPHFGEGIFDAFLELPGNVPQILFPIVLKHLPNVKRFHRRVQLLNMMTRILENPHGTDAMAARGNDFNRTVLQLLNEDYMQNKENEKKFVKSLTMINKWLGLIEKKRNACSYVNVGDMRRRLTTISQMSTDPIESLAKQLLTTLQRIESKVHPKQRMFT